VAQGVQKGLAATQSFRQVGSVLQVAEDDIRVHGLEGPLEVTGVEERVCTPNDLHVL